MQADALTLRLPEQSADDETRMHFYRVGRNLVCGR